MCVFLPDSLKQEGKHRTEKTQINNCEHAAKSDCWFLSNNDCNYCSEYGCQQHLIEDEYGRRLIICYQRSDCDMHGEHERADQCQNVAWIDAYKVSGKRQHADTQQSNSCCQNGSKVNFLFEKHPTDKRNEDDIGTCQKCVF